VRRGRGGGERGGGGEGSGGGVVINIFNDFTPHHMLRSLQMS